MGLFIFETFMGLSEVRTNGVPQPPRKNCPLYSIIIFKNRNCRSPFAAAAAAETETETERRRSPSERDGLGKKAAASEADVKDALTLLKQFHLQIPAATRL